MPHLQSLLHPVRSAAILSRRARMLYLRAYEGMYVAIAQRQFRKLARGRRDKCWCGGDLLPFKWHDGYGICASCDCYVNRYPPLPEALKRIYSFDVYWHTRARLKGHPSIEHRTSNDLSDGRVACWLNLIGRYGPAAGRVVEVGCAHGVLLRELSALGYECIGVEPDKRTAEWTRQNTGLDIRPGFFPDVTLPSCDLFLAFDVVEHSPEPDVFVKGIAGLLNPGGIAILQTPINRYDSEPPFAERFEAAFDDVEHLYLFTDAGMRELARRSALEVVSLSERLWLHHEVCVLRKPS